MKFALLLLMAAGGDVQDTPQLYGLTEWQKVTEGVTMSITFDRKMAADATEMFPVCLADSKIQNGRGRWVSPLFEPSRWEVNAKHEVSIYFIPTAPITGKCALLTAAVK